MSRAAIAVRKEKLLTSPKLQAWLDEPLFVLGDGTSWSRRDISILTESPCTRAARVLHHWCERFQVRSIDRLATMGLAAMLRCTGVGERTAWVAAIILHNEGYDVETWIHHTSAAGRGPSRRQSLKDKLHLVHSRTRKAKHT